MNSYHVKNKILETLNPLFRKIQAEEHILELQIKSYLTFSLYYTEVVSSSPAQYC